MRQRPRGLLRGLGVAVEFWSRTPRVSASSAAGGVELKADAQVSASRASAREGRRLAPHIEAGRSAIGFDEEVSPLQFPTSRLRRPNAMIPVPVRFLLELLELADLGARWCDQETGGESRQNGVGSFHGEDK